MCFLSNKDHQISKKGGKARRYIILTSKEETYQLTNQMRNYKETARY